MKHYSTVVIGGGAAGIMAAGVAAATGRNVLLCERMEKPQRKVRITGKGRCNLTNLCNQEEFLAKVRSGANFIRYAWQQFDCETTMHFFEQIGVPLSVERGRRVFPTSGRAWDVAEAHIAWCRQQGVEITTHARVEEITVRNKQITGVFVRYDDNSTEQITCQTVILATGGASYPATGSTGDGYRLAHRLGHTIVPIRPSLTPLIADRPTPKPLIDFTLRNVSAQLYIDSKKVAEEFGELTFTTLGVGGAIVLRLSRQAVDALIDEHHVELRLDLKTSSVCRAAQCAIRTRKGCIVRQSTNQTFTGETGAIRVDRGMGSSLKTRPNPTDPYTHCNNSATIDRHPKILAHHYRRLRFISRSHCHCRRGLHRRSQFLDHAVKIDPWPLFCRRGTRY